MKRSEIVAALADLASQGTYQVKPAVARQMNIVFEAAANLINELEAEEAASAATPTIVIEDNDNDDS